MPSWLLQYPINEPIADLHIYQKPGNIFVLKHISQALTILEPPGLQIISLQCRYDGGNIEIAPEYTFIRVNKVRGQLRTYFVKLLSCIYTFA